MSNGNTLIHILIDAKFNNNIGDFSMLQKLFKIFNSLSCTRLYGRVRLRFNIRN